LTGSIQQALNGAPGEGTASPGSHADGLPLDKSARIGDFENGNLHVRRMARGHPVRDRLKLVQRIFQTIEQYGRRSTCRLTLTDVGLHVRRHAPRAGSTDVQVQSASTQGA